ncbi:MAG: sulfotransferase [Saprospiraceae bacterium]
MTTTPPIIISSPVRRSGTTLLQRLLTSAPNTLIYGESCANDFQMFTNFYLAKQLQLAASKNWRNEQLDSVLEGNVNDWIPDLMPNIDEYLEDMKKSFLQFFNSYPNFAKQKNRTNWGMKLPEWNPTNLKLIEQFFPNFKIIYITRNLEDCVRSAKKVEMVKGINEVNQYCQIWKMHKDTATQQNFKPENTMYISYESFVENPQPILTNLEKFTGAKGIDASVMNFKFNKFKETTEENETFGEYVSPAELTDEELEMVKKYSA